MPPPHRVLLIEDDDDDAFFTRRALAAASPETVLTVVTDGDLAVEYLTSAAVLPDHVLLDLKLPRRSGLEVLRWLRQNPATRDLPVTILSGSQLDVDVAEATALGIDGYIRKPVDYAGFLAAIRGFCQRADMPVREPA